MQVKDTLITEIKEEENKVSSSQPPKHQNYKVKLHFKLVFVVVIILIGLLIYNIIKGKSPVPPIKIQIPWVAGKTIFFQVGNSRVFEPLLYSGYDNRSLPNFRQVTQRQVQWSIEPEGIINVDAYGRINAIKIGSCLLKVKSKFNGVEDSRNVQVIQKWTQKNKVTKRIIHFGGEPTDTFANLQKLVSRYSKNDALKDSEVPKSVKYAIQHLNESYPISIIAGSINWTKMNYANGSDNQFILRVNNSMRLGDRDREQYFIGDRYIPDNGTKVVMIQKDDLHGIWVVGPSGNVTHISMVSITYSDKAQMMNEQTDKFIIRQGLASGANHNGTSWIPQISDNDGLWTSIYGAGQLMKYSVLKERKMDPKVVIKARQRAIKSLKAVLLTANVAGREGRVNAKIRYLNNTRSGNGVLYSHQYLLKGKPNLRDTYVGLPSDGDGFYGLDSNKRSEEGNFYQGMFSYSMLPINKNDWNTEGDPALTERNLDGYISRTFVVEPVTPSIPSGLFFKRHQNVTHSVLSGAQILYDFEKDDHPSLELGNKPIPEILKSIINIDGVQYDSKDMIYKGDTSSDQVIGHLFIYKIAFDILDESDNQQSELKQLIKQTMINYCQHLINNGYIMVDATGQATRWTKFYKQFLTSDFEIQDCQLKALELLLSFKLAYYVTGETRWKDEYEMLAKDEKYKYAQLMGHMWDKWIWAFTRADLLSHGLNKFDYTLKPSKIQIERRLLYMTHFSDQQEAFLAFYLIFQLEDDPQLLQMYRKGMEGYWHSVSWSENPLWYFIYQLSNPNKALLDSYGQDLRETASWQLSRHMIDTTSYQAYLIGSRDDVIFEGPISVNPKTIIGKRTSLSDQKYVNSSQNYLIFKQFNPKNIYEVKVLPADQRSIHKFNSGTFTNIGSNHNPRNMQPSTTYTAPYWLGVYHKLLKME